MGDLILAEPLQPAERSEGKIMSSTTSIVASTTSSTASNQSSSSLESEESDEESDEESPPQVIAIVIATPSPSHETSSPLKHPWYMFGGQHILTFVEVPSM